MSLIKCENCGTQFDDSFDCCPFCGASCKKESNSNNNETLEDDSLNTYKDREWINKWRQKVVANNAKFGIPFSILAIVCLVCMTIGFSKAIKEGIEVDLSLWFIVPMIILFAFICFLFLLIPIGYVKNMFKPKIMEQNIDGYIVLVCESVHYNYLVYDGIVLDWQHYYAGRHGDNIRVLKGNLPNGIKLWVEFKPETVLHAGDNREYKNK